MANYKIHFSHLKSIEEVFNSDSSHYGGSGKVNQAPHILFQHEGKPEAIEIQLAPLATMIFRI